MDNRTEQAHREIIAIVGRAFENGRSMLSGDAEREIGEVLEQLSPGSTRKAALEEAANIAERYGCGKPGCTDCHAGAAAAHIRSLISNEPAKAPALAEIENLLASPILGITLGPDLEGKITEQQALALVNASRECLLAGVRAMGSPKQQGGPDV